MTSTGAAGPSFVRRPVTLRSRPFLFITTFVLVHQAISTASLPPAYYFFQSTGSATSVLAGPYAAFVLRQNVPFTGKKVEDYVEGTVRAMIGSSWKLWGKYRAGKKDGSVDPENADRVAKEAVASMEGKTWKLRSQVVDRASGVKLQQVIDATAAYLLVKVS